MLVRCPISIVDMTLERLREAGQASRECVMLWLGRRQADGTQVIETYRPLQFAEADMFRIPPEGMTELLARLRQLRLMVAAQVHSHPKEAFHSRADDRWAIVRHEGALSLVVPHFAAATHAGNFLSGTKVYRFSGDAKWLEVKSPELEQRCLLIC